MERYSITKIRRPFFYIAACFIAAVFVLCQHSEATALSASRLNMFSQNNIMFYDPDEQQSHSQYCKPGTSMSVDNQDGTTGSTTTPVETEVSGTGVDRVKSATRVYGQLAMQAQKTYGVPWEVLIAQMQVESQTGTSDVAVNSNNWLGIKGKGDAGSYGIYAKFSSVEASIQAWAGSYVMRNGYYDNAFQYLDPNNWDLHRYLQSVISVYAPASDGNDEAGYVSNIESIIEKMIKPVREEMGWPSSEELAKQGNIPIGGMYPIGSEVGGDLAAGGPAICVSGSLSAGNGDINATALLLSWPERDHGPDDPKPEYKDALAQTGVNQLGDECSMTGKSCDAFVATVMRFSGADPNFPCCGAAMQLEYMSSHPELYQEIENIGSAENMMPGDIRSRSGHIEMYVIEEGVGKIASASHCDRTGDRGRPYYPNSEYRIFRKI